MAKVTTTSTHKEDCGIVGYVADWISQLIDRPVSKQRGWEYLRQMDLRLRVPRPSHQEADPIEQEAWKKKLDLKVKQIRLEYPDAVVEVWAMDEHRLKLKPVLRSCLDTTCRTTSSRCKLALSIVMAIWFCSPTVG